MCKYLFEYLFSILWNIQLGLDLLGHIPRVLRAENKALKGSMFHKFTQLQAPKARDLVLLYFAPSAPTMVTGTQCVFNKCLLNSKEL